MMAQVRNLIRHQACDLECLLISTEAKLQIPLALIKQADVEFIPLAFWVEGKQCGLCFSLKYLWAI